MHKKEIEWRIGNVKRDMTELQQTAAKLTEFPDSVFVYEQLIKCKDRQLANLELQLKNA